MNKIEIVNETINKDNIDDSINIKVSNKKSLFDIKGVTLEIISSTNLFLDINFSSYTKIKINIAVLNNIDCNIFIKETGISGKIMYDYSLLENSNVNVVKYNRINNINEMVVVNLNGIGSKIDYLFKSLNIEKENYDYNINHNFKNTVSNIKNHGVNIKGCMNVQISSTVLKGITNCTCNQFNRIINLTNNKCEIRPILYIDNDLVDANHSALIGDFDSDELFYLESLGIDKKSAYRLLIEGFIISGINNDILKKEIDSDLKKYWR